MCSQTVGLSLLSSISGPWPAQPSSAQLTVVILPAPAPALARPGCAAVTHWRAFPVFVSLQLIQPDTPATTRHSRHTPAPGEAPQPPSDPVPLPPGGVHACCDGGAVLPPVAVSPLLSHPPQPGPAILPPPGGPSSVQPAVT